MKRLRRITRIRSAIIIVVLVSTIIAGYLYIARPLPEFLVAKRAIPAGQSITEQDFSTVSLDLGPISDFYLGPENFLPGAKLSNPLRPGELVSLNNLNGFSVPGNTVIKFQPKLPLSQSLDVGDRVMLWRVEVESLGLTQEAEQIVSAGTIQAIEFPEGLFNDELPFVEISLPERSLPLLLQSLSAGFDVYVVAPGTLL